MARKDAAKPRSEPERVQYRQAVTPDAAAAYLEAIARDLRAGTMAISGAERSLTAPVAGDVGLEVEARRGKRKFRIELTLSFRTPVVRPAEAVGADGDSRPGATIPDEMRF